MYVENTQSVHVQYIVYYSVKVNKSFFYYMECDKRIEKKGNRI